MAKINVFLDDIRRCPEGFVLARSVRECVMLLETSEVHSLSLDYDLGYGEPNGYDLALIMVARALYPDFIYLHSSDSSMRCDMYRILTAGKPDCVTVINGPIPE